MRLSGKEQIRMHEEVVVKGDLPGACEDIGKTVGSSSSTTCTL
jgi:hypothetical protein